MSDDPGNPRLKQEDRLKVEVLMSELQEHFPGAKFILLLAANPNDNGVNLLSNLPRQHAIAIMHEFASRSRN